MPIEWGSLAASAASAAIENREGISGVFRSLVDRIFGKKHHIAFTGMEGSGKSVLFDYLSKRAYESGYHYKPPEPSQHEEHADVKMSKARTSLHVIPGQKMDARHVVTDRLFDRKRAQIEGIIHVVSYGYATTRKSVAISQLQQSVKSIDEYRKYQMRLEIEDLRNTLNLIARSYRNYKKPKWLLVVAAKADLYWDRRTEAQEYYSPLGQSEFSVILRETIREEIGNANISLDTMPASTWSEEFIWGSNRQPSQLTEKEKNNLLVHLENKINSYHGWTP